MIRSISLMVFPIALLGICNLCDRSKITVSSSFQMITVNLQVLTRVTNSKKMSNCHNTSASKVPFISNLKRLAMHVLQDRTASTYLRLYGR